MRRRLSNPDPRPARWILPWLLVLLFAAPGLAEWPPSELVAQSEASGLPLLWGTVESEGGSPIAGATLRLSSDPRFLDRYRAGHTFETETDSQGRFAVLSPAPRGHLFTLTVEAAMHLLRDVPVLEIDGEPQRYVLEPAALVRGRVVDHQGAPLAGAEWQLSSDTGPMSQVLPARPFGRGTTDTEGRFVAEGRPGVEARIRVFAPGWQGVSERFLIEPAGVDLPDVMADEPVLLARFQLLGSEGAPAGGAMLRIVRVEGNQNRSQDNTVPDDGTVEMPWRPGSAQLQASHPALGTAELDYTLTLDNALPSGEPRYAGVGEVAILRLEPESPGAPIEVSGQVIDPSGNPLAGVDVQLLGGPQHQHRVQLETDDQGRWRAAIGEANEYQLWLTSHPRLEVRRFVTIERGMEPLQDVLGLGGILEGEIHGLEPRQLGSLILDLEHPLGNSVVDAEIKPGDPPKYRLAGIPLEGTRLRVRLHHRAPARDFGPLVFERDGEVQRRDLILEPGLETRLSLAVDYQRIHELVWSVDCAGRSRASGMVAGGDGEWTVYDLEPGRCSLLIQGTLDRTDAIGLWREVWFVEDGQTIELAHETGRLSGRVVDRLEDSQGETRDLALYLAPLEHPDLRFESCELEADGSFDFEKVIAGTWLLRLVDHQLTPLAQWPVEVDGDVVVDLSIADSMDLP